MYQVHANENGVESIAHPEGSHKAAFDLSRFFGRDAIREIIDRMDLRETETVMNDLRYKVFHNSEVAITFSKDPWQDYPRDEQGNKVKKPVYKDKWGENNPLKPARSGYIHIIGTQSEVMRAYNLINWNSFNKGESLNYWGF